MKPQRSSTGCPCATIGPPGVSFHCPTWIEPSPSRQFGRASDEALQETIRRSEQQAINLLQTPEGMKYDRGEAARLQLESRFSGVEL